jgi:ribosomal protein S18 acetylase RimI-like enzyme
MYHMGTRNNEWLPYHVSKKGTMKIDDYHHLIYKEKESMFPPSNPFTPDRRFLRDVLELALGEAHSSQKDYLGAPHLFLALMALEGGCTQDALQRMGFSPRHVSDTFHLALGSGKATANTPILPTRRCKEILQMAERTAIDARAPSIDERAIAQAVLSEHAGVIYELLKKLGIDPPLLSAHILSSNAHAALELAPSVATTPDANSTAEAVLPSVSMHSRKDGKDQQPHLSIDLAQVTLPAGVTIRAWTAADFPAVQHIGGNAGWTSFTQRPAEALLAWKNSWPALVAVANEDIIGFVYGLTDGTLTMYITGLAVDAQWRRHGVGRALLDACHSLYPTTGLYLLAVDDARAFYEACGFEVVYSGMRKSPLADLTR